MDDNLDTFDHRILALLEADARRTGEQLSAKVGLSPAACLRRVQRLRKIGAIEREVAVIAPSLRNRGTKVFVLISFDRQNPRLMDEYCQLLRQQEEVVSLNWVTGDDDILLTADCRSMDDFNDFCERFFFDKPVDGYKCLVSQRQYET